MVPRVSGILIEGALFDGVKLSESLPQSPTLSQVSIFRRIFFCGDL
jgi:hypothetical protein